MAGPHTIRAFTKQKGDLYVNKNKEIVEKVNASLVEGGVEGFLSFCADDVT